MSLMTRVCYKHLYHASDFRRRRHCVFGLSVRPIIIPRSPTNNPLSVRFSAPRGFRAISWECIRRMARNLLCGLKLINILILTCNNALSIFIHMIWYIILYPYLYSDLQFITEFPHTNLQVNNELWFPLGPLLLTWFNLNPSIEK